MLIMPALPTATVMLEEPTEPIPVAEVPPTATVSDGIPLKVDDRATVPSADPVRDGTPVGSGRGG
jgi:hypothetical protein